MAVAGAQAQRIAPRLQPLQPRHAAQLLPHENDAGLIAGGHAHKQMGQVTTAGTPRLVAVDQEAVARRGRGRRLRQAAARRAAQPRFAAQMVEQAPASCVTHDALVSVRPPGAHLALVADDLVLHRGDKGSGGAALGQFQLGGDAGQQ